MQTVASKFLFLKFPVNLFGCCCSCSQLHSFLCFLVFLVLYLQLLLQSAAAKFCFVLFLVGELLHLLQSVNFMILKLHIDAISMFVAAAFIKVYKQLDLTY